MLRGYTMNSSKSTYVYSRLVVYTENGINMGAIIENGDYGWTLLVRIQEHLRLIQWNPSSN